jgi:hypothetical protein
MRLPLQGVLLLCTPGVLLLLVLLSPPPGVQSAPILLLLLAPLLQGVCSLPLPLLPAIRGGGVASCPSESLLLASLLGVAACWGGSA